MAWRKSDVAILSAYNKFFAFRAANRVRVRAEQRKLPRLAASRTKRPKLDRFFVSDGMSIAVHSYVGKYIYGSKEVGNTLRGIRVRTIHS